MGKSRKCAKRGLNEGRRGEKIWGLQFGKERRCKAVKEIEYLYVTKSVAGEDH